MPEPKFHFFADCLDDRTDLRAYTSIHCVDCYEIVHAENNETLSAWFDTKIGCVCLECFTKRYNESPTVENPDWVFDELGDGHA